MLGAWLALGALPISGGCRDSGQPTPMSRETYIALYVEILQAADSAEDTLAAFRRGAEILAERGYSYDDFDAFARRHAGDPEFLADAWSEIEARLRNPRGRADQTDEEADEDEEDAGEPDDPPEDKGAGRT